MSAGDEASTGGAPVEGGLATERLRLRRPRPDDIDALVKLDDDPEVMRWLSGGQATPRSVIEDVVLPGLLATDPLRPWLGAWVIEDPDGAFLGWVTLRPMDAAVPTCASLGYRLRRAAWGKGIATEASHAVLRRAFAEGDLERVEASAYEDNRASRRVLEKLGLRMHARYRLTLDDLARTDTFDGGAASVWDGDDLVYRLDRADWRG
jgi:RimJ/RimL family protein N-acetyltransferase